MVELGAELFASVFELDSCALCDAQSEQRCSEYASAFRKFSLTCHADDRRRDWISSASAVALQRATSMLIDHATYFPAYGCALLSTRPELGSFENDDIHVWLVGLDRWNHRTHRCW